MTIVLIYLGSQVVLVVKNVPANAGDIRHAGSIPGSGRSPGEGNVKPVQYSYLENPMDRGSLVGFCIHGVTKSRTCLSLPALTHGVISY